MAEFGSPSTIYCKLFFRPNSFTRTDGPQFQATPAGQVFFLDLHPLMTVWISVSIFDTIGLKHCHHIGQMCESTATKLRSDFCP